jgi:hypothetical protein
MRLPLALVVLAAAPAIADTSFIIKVSNRVTEVHPSATVEVWAEFNEDLFAFAGSKFDFYSVSDSGSFTDPQCMLDDPGTFPGDVSQDGDSVTGIICGQLCFEPMECFGDFSNPVRIWVVTWSTNDFASRSIALATDTSVFDVYLSSEFHSASFLDELVEGSGVIEVGCYADCTGDETQDLFDFLCFVNQFNAGAQSADCDGNQSLDLFDFLCFVNRFNAGC